MFYLYNKPLAIGSLIIDNTAGDNDAEISIEPISAEINGEGSLIVGEGTAVVPINAEIGPEGGGGFMNEWGTIIIMYVAVFAAMYFLWIKPQNKKRRAVMEMQAAIKEGDNVLTSSGMYGTISVLGDEDCLVEFGTNKGIKIPVRRADIVGVRDPNLNTSVVE